MTFTAVCQLRNPLPPPKLSSKYYAPYTHEKRAAEPIADRFALSIAAFLPPKIMQADNGKESKGAILILLWKSSHIDWLNRKDLTIGLEQKNPTMGSIFESELQPELELESETEALIDPRLWREPELGVQFRAQLRRETELGIELSGSGFNSEPSSGSEPELGLDSELPPKPEMVPESDPKIDPELEPELELEPSPTKH
ncbi:hypothetical protein V499_00181 [Pseudogymnoascus sp. VKM F-103]|nr:hypothetical protein V499_00181 [Pseudogymnoascus sp. VKM F-103]